MPWTPHRPLPARRRATLLPLLALVLLQACAPVFARSRPAGAAALRATLDSVFADTALTQAHWGVLVRSLDDGEVIYRQNAEKLFVPASNMKLVTGAAALQALGPAYRYRTRVLAAGPVRDGALRGDLIVVGSGDPTLSVRFGGDARAVFRAWADSLRARGIRRVTGNLVGIDSVFDDVPLGRGWAWDDLDAAYSAEISGLQFNEGAIAVRVYAGRAVGDAGVVVLDPPTAYVPVVNQTRTVAAGRAGWLDATREPQGAGLRLRGEVPLGSDALNERFATRNPTAYFVGVLRETLREAGVAVEGAAIDADEWPERATSAAGAAPLFTHASPPLAEILPAYLKPSQNQIAETLLRTLGRELRGEGSSRAGAAAEDSVLRAGGLPTARRLVIADGSGLSRYNLVSPAFLADLLTRMAQGPHAQLWQAALPVAGVDGTLASRLRGTPAERNVHAKTGTLSSVRALSGYLTTAAGERLVFSMLANHHARAAADVDRVVDAALARLAEWR